MNLRKDHLQLVIELFWALAWTAEGVGGGGGGGGGAWQCLLRALIQACEVHILAGLRVCPVCAQWVDCARLGRPLARSTTLSIGCLSWGDDEGCSKV